MKAKQCTVILNNVSYPFSSIRKAKAFLKKNIFWTLYVLDDYPLNNEDIPF